MLAVATAIPHKQFMELETGLGIIVKVYSLALIIYTVNTSELETGIEISHILKFHTISRNKGITHSLRV